MDFEPLKKPFRIGLMRGTAYKPIATIGIARDAGIFVAPAAVGEQGWNYGVARKGEAALIEPMDHVSTPARPKLHYHRSGVASVTLTGVELERRTLRLPPVETVARGQILSIVAIRPWTLATAPASSRKGDLILLEPKWPQEVAIGLSLLHYDDTVPHPPGDMAEFGPVGLLPGDDSRFRVDLSHYIPGVVLVGSTKVSHRPSIHLEPSITVAALPWDPERRESPSGVMALWSESLRNPNVYQELDNWLPSTESFANLARTGELIAASPREHTRRIFGTSDGLRLPVTSD
jgi:hypothetical protein